MADHESTARDVVIAVEGSFDPMEAQALRVRVLRASAASAKVVVDFGRAREVSDLGLALLAHGLATSGAAHVRLRGLSQHHERMLRYLGVHPAASPLGDEGRASA